MILLYDMVNRTRVESGGYSKQYSEYTYFFEMSVFFETGELNAYVYDGGGLYRRKYV